MPCEGEVHRKAVYVGAEALSLPERLRRLADYNTVLKDDGVTRPFRAYSLSRGVAVTIRALIRIYFFSKLELFGQIPVNCSPVSAAELPVPRKCTWTEDRPSVFV